jgi:outer membrane protein assembly factor BamB
LEPILAEQKTHSDFKPHASIVTLCRRVQMSPLAIIALAAISAFPRPTPIVVLQDASPGSCVTAETIASALAMNPRLRVLRRTVASLGLPDAIALPAPDIAAVVWGQQDKDWQSGFRTTLVSVEGTVHSPGAARSITEGLSIIWPRSLPELNPQLVADLPNPESVLARCQGDWIKARELAGAALGVTIFDESPVDVGLPAGPGTVLSQLSRAERLRKGQRCQAAVPAYQGVLAQLERGSIAPVWVRNFPSEAEQLSVLPPFIVRFSEGAFQTVAIESGQPMFQTKVGSAHPELIPVGDKFLAVLEDAVQLIEAPSGTVVWTHKLDHPSPETPSANGIVFVADVGRLVALSIASGKEIWAFDGLVDLPAGPVIVGSEVIQPGESELFVLRAVDGSLVRRIPARDELSSPLLRTEDGKVWFMAGSEDALLANPANQGIEARIEDLHGADWPPAVLGPDRLVFALERGRSSSLLLITRTDASLVRKSFRGGVGPVLAFPKLGLWIHREDRNRSLLGRRPDGRIAWRFRTREPMGIPTIDGDQISLVSGNDVLIISAENGRIRQKVGLDEAIHTTALSPEGGVAETASGRLYGLPTPGDPRPGWWLRKTRIGLAKCAVETKRPTLALASLKPHLEQVRTDIEAEALAATAAEHIKPAGAAARWLTVHRMTTEQDPVRPEAIRGLEAMAGVERLDMSVDAIATVAPDIAITRKDRNIRAFRLAAPGLSLWTLTGTSLTPMGDRWIQIDGRILDPTTGRNVAPALVPPRRWEARGAHLFAIDNERIRRHPLGTSVGWEQTLDRPGTLVMDADERHVLLTTPGDNGLVQLLDVTDGARRWMIPYAEAVMNARLLGDHILVVTSQRIVIVDRISGSLQTQVKVPSASIRRLERLSDGFLLGTLRDLLVIEPKSGAVRRRVRLPGDLVDLATSSGVEDGRAHESGVVRIAGDRLLAVDLSRGLVKSVVSFGPLNTLTNAGERIVAQEDRGGLLLIKPGRFLLPKAAR